MARGAAQGEAGPLGEQRDGVGERAGAEVVGRGSGQPQKLRGTGPVVVVGARDQQGLGEAVAGHGRGRRGAPAVRRR